MAGLPTKPNGPRHCGNLKEFVFGLLSNPLQLMTLSKCRKHFYVGVQDGIVALIEKSTVSNQISQLDLESKSIQVFSWMSNRATGEDKEVKIGQKKLF